jgi:hypothetical protein
MNVLSEAILQTVIYSDIFDYPLSAHEIQRYLSGLEASLDEVITALGSNSAVRQAGVYYVLPGRQNIVEIRIQREKRSKELLPTALRYGRVLGRLPFIRMVALTGSLAVMNISGDEDLDYMLVTAPGRLWIARAFALLFNRFVKLFGHTICPNLILSENALEWSKHDLYSARELCQMIPVTGLDIYRRLMESNQWVGEFLPNAYSEAGGAWHSQGAPPHSQKRTLTGTRASAFQKFLEFMLSSELGNRFEQWEMNRKIARFSTQEGFGEETLFNADVCQGNFDHHGKWTRETMQQRLDQLQSDSLSQLGRGVRGEGARAT